MPRLLRLPTDDARAPALPLHRVAAAGAALLFALMCLVPRGGLLSDEQFVDAHLYRTFSARMLDGLLPYRDFFVEYPPGAILAFVPPGWAAQEHYIRAFRIEMAIVGALTVAVAVLLLARGGAAGRRLLLVAALLGLSPLLLGELLLNGYDLWPTLLLVVAVALLAGRRDTLAFAVLGLATFTKVFPIAIALLALMWAWRRGGRAAVLRGVAAFAATAFAVCIYWVAIAPGGVGYSFQQQLRRGLQNESLGASALFVLDRLGLYDIHLAMRPPGSLDVIGGAGQAVGAVTTVLEVAAVLWVVVLAWRSPRTRETVLLASAAALCAFVAFGKVFSPQYLVWLLPLVPLVGGGTGLAAIVLLAASAGLTEVWVLGAVRPFAEGSAAIWLVVLRNVLIAALYGVLLVRLRRHSSST